MKALPCPHLRFFAHLIVVLALALVALPAQAAGTGLTGQYYDNNDFTNLKFTRVDSAVDWSWGAGSPSNSIAADTFSVRWSGQIEPAYSETYLFYVTADDGARLWVNDRLLAARTFFSSAYPEMSGRIALKAGRRYNIVLEFIEGSGNASVNLEWASSSQPRQTIPQTQLYPTTGVPELGSMLIEHWMDLPGANLDVLTANPNFPARPDSRDFFTAFECLQTDWADDYGTRAVGLVVPPIDGVYTFAVAGSDAVQLFLSTNASSANKILIASNSAPTGFRQFLASPSQVSQAITLAAHQKYYIELQHKAASGPDHFSVAWRPPGSDTFSVIPGDVLIPAGLDRSQPPQTAYLDTLVPSHPRLLASPERFAWLKRSLASNSIPQLNSWFGSISNSASGMLSQPVSVYNQDVRGTILNISRTVLDRVYKLALTWHVTGNTNFAERAWAELDQVASANFPDWHPAHFLDTAEMTHACAIGYDWLYSYWSQPRRDTIRTAIITKGLNPSLTLYTNNSGWVASGANNWNLVCNGGMILGALAVGTENEPLAEFVLSKAVASAALVMRHYTTDCGGWYEGPGYWDYTTDYNIRLLAGLESALGSDLGLSDIQSVWETGLNPFYMVGPNRLSFNYADAGAGNMRGAQLFWLARRYNRPEFSWYERNNASAEPLDLLWYDARGSDPQTTGLQPDNFFRGPAGATPYHPADAITLRSRWLDSDATFIGFKAGEIGASHGHLDGGSFVLDALGVRWAHDLGGDDYALPGYFSTPQRWTYYRMRAEGHNTLVINPGSAADQVVNARPPVLLYTTEPSTERSAVIADLTSLYGVSKAWRGVQLLNNRRWMLVQDELQAGSPAAVWWFMHVHTNSGVSIAPDGASVTLSQANGRLWLKILSGQGVFTLRDAVPLPTSPNPAGQNANSNFRKLAIQLASVTNSTLAVLMVPLRAAESPPTNLPPVLALSDWSAAGTNSFAAPTNHPPEVSATAQHVPVGSFLDVDLRSLVSDQETPPDRLLFSVGQPTNGSVTLLPDLHTARFVPNAGFSGMASFKLITTDAWPDPRMLSQHDFEPPEDVADLLVSNRSLQGIPGMLNIVGSGTNYLVTDSPPVLASWSTQCLLLRETGDLNGSRLVASVYGSDLQFNSQSWTVAAWFKRAATTNDDFVFYLGTSDGFGSPNEFHVHCPTGQNTLSAVHFTGQSTTDLNLSAPNIRPGEWHHFAIVFLSTNANSGQVSFYVDGALAGFDPEVTLNMPADLSAVFGGHASSTFAVTRWFNGRLDDLVVCKGALAPAEISALAARPALYLGGSSVTNTIRLDVVPPNYPPTITAPANQTVVAGAALELATQAQDPDTPAQNLRFSLLSAPAGATIDPTTGLMLWRPPVAAAGSSNFFSIQAQEAGWHTNLIPVADAFVRDGSSAGLNFGSDPSLTVKLGALGLSRESFLRFAAPTLPGNLAAADLVLNPISLNLPGTHLLGWVENDNWSENLITWNTKPGSSQVLATWIPEADTTARLSLRALYANEVSGDGLISLRIYSTNATADGRVDYASKETGTGPMLQVTSTNWSTLASTRSFWVKVTAPASPVLSNARIQNGNFEMVVEGDAGPDYTVQSSTNLVHWTTLLTTNSLTGSFLFSTPRPALGSAYFYRILLGP